MSRPSRSLSVGDDCPECGREVTETTAGGLLGYCWWCNERTEADADLINREHKYRPYPIVAKSSGKNSLAKYRVNTTPNKNAIHFPIAFPIVAT